MTPGEAVIRAEIEALNIEFWYRVDHAHGQGVAELFCEDGVYSVPGGQNAGRAAIAASYVQRRERGPRVSRHVQSNLHLTVVSDTEASGESLLTLWARDGSAPLPIAFPVSVSDVRDEYTKGSDAAWRIVHRHITPAFVGDEPSVLSFAPDEPDRAGS